MLLIKKHLSIVLASLCLLIRFVPKTDANTVDVLKSAGKGVLTTSAVAGGVVVGAAGGVSLLYYGVTGLYELGCKIGLFSEGSTSESFLNRILAVVLWGRAGTFDALTPVFVYGTIATIGGAAVGGTLAGKTAYKALS